MKQEPIQDSRHNMRMMYAQAMHDQKEQLKVLPIEQAIAKPNVICCGVLELMQLGWMKLEDGRKCMPYIDGHSDENIYRVNNCPSCGKYVRDLIVEPC